MRFESWRGLNFFFGKNMFCKSSIESIVAKVLHEDVGMISNLPTLTNPQAAFMKLSLCYAQCLGYLFHIMFPSPGFLSHYVEFNTHTLELGWRSYLVRDLLVVLSVPQLIIRPLFLFLQAGLASFLQLGLLPPHLGCWVLITLAFVIRFQQDDHPILLDVVTHFETSISLLPQVVHSQVPPFENLMVQFYISLIVGFFGGLPT